MTASPDPRARFSDRVAHYVRHRPRYPVGLLDVLRDRVGLEPGWSVADVGSGTGFSSEPFLAQGNRVLAVEPNAEMRAAAEALYGDRAGFESVAGGAEDTGLADASVDLVVAGQAFHWFDAEAARREFARILRGRKPVALFWNTRLVDESDFAVAYEALLLRFGTDYRAIRHDHHADEALARFFGGAATVEALSNEQFLDLDGLRGRLLSSSYTPPPAHPDHAPMMAELDDLWARHARAGRVRVGYRTEIHCGWLA